MFFVVQIDFFNIKLNNPLQIYKNNTRVFGGGIKILIPQCLKPRKSDYHFFSKKDQLYLLQYQISRHPEFLSGFNPNGCSGRNGLLCIEDTFASY